MVSLKRKQNVKLLVKNLVPHRHHRAAMVVNHRAAMVVNHLEAVVVVVVRAFCFLVLDRLQQIKET
jgi:hypothetical protein